MKERKNCAEFVYEIWKIPAMILRMNTTAQQFRPHDDGRGLYPANIKVYVPRELPAQIYAAAEAESCSVSEFIRRAIAVRLETVKVG